MVIDFCSCKLCALKDRAIFALKHLAFVCQALLLVAWLMSALIVFFIALSDRYLRVYLAMLGSPANRLFSIGTLRSHQTCCPIAIRADIFRTEAENWLVSVRSASWQAGLYDLYTRTAALASMKKSADTRAEVFRGGNLAGRGIRRHMCTCRSLSKRLKRLLTRRGGALRPLNQ